MKYFLIIKLRYKPGLDVRNMEDSWQSVDLCGGGGGLTDVGGRGETFGEREGSRHRL